MLGDQPPDSRTLEIDDAVSAKSGGEWQPQLFVALECARPTAGGARFSLEGIDEVVFGRGRTRAFEAGESEKSRTLRLPDRVVSSRHARIWLEGRELWFEDLGSRNGSRVDDNKVERSRVRLQDGALLEIGGTFLFVHTKPRAGPPPAARSFDSACAGAPLGMTTLLPSYAATLSDLEQKSRS